MPPIASTGRQSIEPTYDFEKTGPRFKVESRLNGKVIHVSAERDPFLTHRIVIGWRVLLGFILGGREVQVRVDGVDREIVEDVCELDSDYTGRHDSTRRTEWREQVESGLRAFAEKLP